jgi:hypothetical protein
MLRSAMSLEASAFRAMAMLRDTTKEAEHE